MIIKYVAFIADNGKINRLARGKIHDGEIEGPSDQGYVKHIFEDIPSGTASFCNEFIYDFEEDTFVCIGESPNDHATYDADEDKWVWDPELVKQDIRRERNRKLSLCDWTVMPDNSLSENQKAQSIEYRQALRDLIGELHNPVSVLDVSWPLNPSWIDAD